MITRLDEARPIIEAEVIRLANHYGLEYFLDSYIDIDSFEHVFTVDFTHTGLEKHIKLNIHADTLHELKDMVKAWIDDILGIEENEPEPELPVVKKPIDPLVEIAKQLRIANELKIVELKHEHIGLYYHEDAANDIKRIEKELKGED